MSVACVRCVKREFLLANRNERWFMIFILINVIVLGLLYLKDDSLRHQAGYTIRKILGKCSKNFQ